MQVLSKEYHYQSMEGGVRIFAERPSMGIFKTLSVLGFLAFLTHYMEKTIRIQLLSIG